MQSVNYACIINLFCRPNGIVYTNNVAIRIKRSGEESTLYDFGKIECIYVYLDIKQEYCKYKLL